MKIGFISDTHTFHRMLTGLEKLDMLIHTGDLGFRGSVTEVFDFITWFKTVPVKHKIFIAGNHDFYLERTTTETINGTLDKNTFYLNDSGITIEGINIWGSPVQPWFNDWAFNRQRGSDIRKHWDLIPDNTDILITHGPPFGILDKVKNGPNVGCKDLLKCVQRIKPKYHAFGHVHEEYGFKETEDTFFINASILNEKYAYVNYPMIIDYK